MEITSVLSLIFVLGSINLIAGFFLIPTLRNLGFYKKKTELKKEEVKKKRYDYSKYYKFFEKTLNTPSSFGVLLILNLIFFCLLLTFSPPIRIDSVNILIIMGAVIWGLFGLFDDILQFFFYHLPIGRWGIPARFKLLIQHAVTLSIVLFILPFATTFTGLFWLAVSVVLITFLINAYNITDGIDGLAGGISLITLITFLIFELLTTSNPFFLTLIAILIAFHLAFLFFNLNPAKVFLGDSGALAIGFLLVIIAMRYSLLAVAPLFLIITIEGLSSAIQMISVKFFKRRIFIIAPLHLTLLNLGIERNTIVFNAWFFQIILALASVYIFFLVR